MVRGGGMGEVDLNLVSTLAEFVTNVGSSCGDGHHIFTEKLILPGQSNDMVMEDDEFEAGDAFGLLESAKWVGGLTMAVKFGIC